MDEFRVSPEEVVESADRVAVIVRIRARGKSSGVEVENRVGHVYTVRDGRAIRLETYASPLAALEAVGVRR